MLWWALVAAEYDWLERAPGARQLRWTPQRAEEPPYVPTLQQCRIACNSVRAKVPLSSATASGGTDKCSARRRGHEPSWPRTERLRAPRAQAAFAHKALLLTWQAAYIPAPLLAHIALGFTPLDAERCFHTASTACVAARS